MSVSNRLSRLLGAVTFSLAFAAVPAAAESRHDHGHSDRAAPAKLELNNGIKWETDAPLRKGMENISNSVAAVHHDIHANRLSAAQRVIGV